LGAFKVIRPPRWLGFVALGILGLAALATGWILEARDGRLQAATSGRPLSQERSAGPGDSVSLAVEDLMRRLNVDRSAIIVVSVEDVTWSDSALGCPQPDYGYAQVLTPGQRIRLEAGGRVYSYHSGPTGPPAYCENPQPAVGEPRSP
jgi:hypothetical protein